MPRIIVANDPLAVSVALGWPARDCDDGHGHLLDGKKPDYRIEQEQYDYANYSENVGIIAFTGDPKQAARQNPGSRCAGMLMEIWKKSPGHRPNLLCDMPEIGVGAARSKSGKWYFCQVFGMPK
jgi:uncharacterized protein YkwD